MIDNILDQHALWCRLLAIATHYDQPVIGKPRALRECESILQVTNDGMAVVGGGTGVMPDQFEASVAVDQNQEFACERQKWNERMWPIVLKKSVGWYLR